MFEVNSEDGCNECRTVHNFGLNSTGAIIRTIRCKRHSLGKFSTSIAMSSAF